MISLKLPKEVLDFFPMWEYRCPKCEQIYDEPKVVCVKCGTQIDLMRDRIPPRFLKNHKAMSDYAHNVLAPKLSPEQRELLFKHFTEIFSDNFESGNFDAWTDTVTAGNATMTVETNNPHHGTYNGRAYTDGVSTSTKAYVYKTLDSSYSTIYVRCYFKTDTIPTAIDRRIVKPIGIRNASGVRIAQVFISKDAEGNFEWGVIALTGGTSTYTQYYVDDNTISADTWYCVELKLVISDSGEFRLYIDDTEKLSQTGIDNNGNGDAKEVDVGLSWYQTNRDGTLGSCQVEETTYVDCVVVADVYIGPEAAAQTYTKTWTTDALFKKLGIPKTFSVDTAFQKQDIPKTFGLDATFQKSFIIQKQIDALFKRFDILKSFTLDARFGALMTQTISRQIDILLKKLDATKTFGLDVYFGPFEAETYAKTFALDAIFAYKVRLPELWLDENGKIVLNISKPYTWVGS